MPPFEPHGARWPRIALVEHGGAVPRAFERTLVFRRASDRAYKSVARLDEPGLAGEQTWQAAPGRRRAPGAWRGGDLEARQGGGGEPIGLPGRAGEDDEPRRAAFSRRRQEAAGGEETVAFQALDLGHDHGGGAGFQRLLHRPEGGGRVGSGDEHEAMQRQPVRDETRPIERARLEAREGLADQQRRGWAEGEEARREREREAHRRRSVLRRGGDDLVQAILAKAAAERGIESARDRYAPGAALFDVDAPFRFDSSDDATQTRRVRHAAWRHSVQTFFVRILFLF